MINLASLDIIHTNARRQLCCFPLQNMCRIKRIGIWKPTASRNGEMTGWTNSLKQERSTKTLTSASLCLLLKLSIANPATRLPLISKQSAQFVWFLSHFLFLFCCFLVKSEKMPKKGSSLVLYLALTCLRRVITQRNYPPRTARWVVKDLPLEPANK